MQSEQQETQILAPAMEGLDGIKSIMAQGADFPALKEQIINQTISHAYLLTGPEGVGKTALAMLFVQMILCNEPNKNNIPCGVCPCCVRFAAGNHPDVYIIDGNKSIGVDAIREILTTTGEHTYEGGKRGIIIKDAAKMTPQAQNALLKTLEEPNEGNIFILIAKDKALLLPTIVSRCRHMPIKPLDDEKIAGFLANQGIKQSKINQIIAMCQGCPELALELINQEKYWALREKVLSNIFAMEGPEDILYISNLFKDDKDESDTLLSMIEELTRMALLVRLDIKDKALLSEYPEKWREAAKSAPIGSFSKILDGVMTARRRKSSQVNWQALLEEMLLNMTEEYRVWQQ